MRDRLVKPRPPASHTLPVTQPHQRHSSRPTSARPPLVLSLRFDRGKYKRGSSLVPLGTRSIQPPPANPTTARRPTSSRTTGPSASSSSGTRTMLDVVDFIKERGGDPDKIRESQRRRHASVEIVDEVIALFEDHRKTQYSATQVNSKINDVQKQIGAKKKAKENADDLLQQKIELEKEKKSLVESAADKDALLKSKIRTIGNFVHDSVPISDNEDHNEVLRTWAPEGVAVEKRNVLSHHEVLLRLDGYDPDRGVKVVGHRGYFLRQWGVFLNQALINYGLEFLTQRGYTALQAPQFMLKEYMAKTAQLEDFDEELYKVVDGDAKNDKYLIATSEQPISAFHADEWLISKDLPIRYAGYSSCYRREAGSHGRDAWGIYRVHQFEKIEQFLLTDPEKSWEALDDMITISEDFYKSLELPYQVVAIVSGALNNAASKKLDLEAWFPFQGEYKELVSCSNCTDYQSRALEIRFGAKSQTDTKKKYVHCLNATLCATTRTMCCVLENYQTEEGLRVPEPLRKYLPGAPEFIPFAKELPKESTSQKSLPQRPKGGK
ncbi:Serine-tRNA ligase, cytoplasmic [Tolypocladium capitatum]|uniref:Serine--tRNA ligase, cytoplasmic n=1 Tax=Tolypocladium capitatum TaxID=45235 RepID=A0A2K3PSS8_9HYPO|nr:Serine-tRNA ligase, cytoplasmic [Tolypocladium capitatum]